MLLLLLPRFCLPNDGREHDAAVLARNVQGGRAVENAISGEIDLVVLLSGERGRRCFDNLSLARWCGACVYAV